jgi:hypothetical protein
LSFCFIRLGNGFHNNYRCICIHKYDHAFPPPPKRLFFKLTASFVSDFSGKNLLI